MNRLQQKVFIVLLIAIMMRFFDARFINSSIINYLQFLFSAIVILISVPCMFPSRKGMVLPMQLMVLAIFLSMVMAYVSWGQGIKDTLVATLPFYTWILFFYLIRIRFPVLKLENIILVFGGIYIVLFFYQYLNTDLLLFGKPLGGGDEWTMNRGVIRILFPGAGIFFLSIFIALNRLTNFDHRKWLWLSFTILGVIIPVLQVTRQFIASVVLIYAFHFLRDQSLTRKMLLFSAFGLFSFIIAVSDHPSIVGLVEAQEETMESGNENIRLLAAEYFLTEFSPNFLSSIAGNGVSYGYFSGYGRYVEKLNQKGFYLEDIGLIAVYIMYGVLGVLSFILIWIKSVTITIPKRYHYTKYYLWFILITSLTSNSPYHPNYLVSTIFAIYIFQVVFEDHETLKRLLPGLNRSLNKMP